MRDTLTTGDARQLTPQLPPASVDLIFTDPIYTNLDDFAWLASQAQRLLRPDGALLTYVPTGSLPAILQALAPLRYRWLFETMIAGPGALYGRLSVTAHRCLWYDLAGASRLRRIVADASLRRPPPRYSRPSATNWSKKHGNTTNWAKCPAFAQRMIEALSPPGGLILDPFAGLASVPLAARAAGRHYIAFEIDPDIADAARQRLECDPEPIDPGHHPG